MERRARLSCAPVGAAPAASPERSAARASEQASDNDNYNDTGDRGTRLDG